MANKPNPNNFAIDIPDTAITFDVDMFDLFLRSQGVTFEHYMAITCPVGLVAKNDQRRPGIHCENCVNGYILVKVGEITAGYQSNSHAMKMIDMGRFDGSTVHVTFPRFYDGTEKACNFMINDRFYLKEDQTVANLSVCTEERIVHSITNTDRTEWPCLAVVFLVDNKGIRYQQNVDFVVESGYIRWVDGRSPEANAIMTVRYVYRPYWVLSQFVHEIRVAQVKNEAGNRVVERMPIGAMLTREYFYRSSDQDPRTEFTLRKELSAPQNNKFGPR